MNHDDQTEELLRRTLREEAESVSSTLTLDDIRPTTHRRPGWRLGALVGVAAAAAIAIPTAIMLRPSDDTLLQSPSPSPSVVTNLATPTPSPTAIDPTPTPSAAIGTIRRGRAPGVTYVQDGTVHLVGGGTARLPDPTAPVVDFTNYHGGWLVGLGGGADRVRWYDNTGAQKFDSPDVGTLAVSADGTRTAYARDGALHIGITSGMSDTEQTVPVQADRFWPIGFLDGDRLVYQAGDQVIVDRGSALPGMVLGRAVSAAADLVAGEDQSGKTLVLSPEGDVVWTSTDWAVWGFSPDGRYAAATNSAMQGEFRSVAILDARTGHVIAQQDLLRDGITPGGRPVMDNDGTLLAAATDADALEQTVVRLDRAGSLTRATPVFQLDPTSDATAVVFAARP